MRNTLRWLLSLGHVFAAPVRLRRVGVGAILRGAGWSQRLSAIEADEMAERLRHAGRLPPRRPSAFHLVEGQDGIAVLFGRTWQQRLTDREARFLAVRL